MSVVRATRADLDDLRRLHQTARYRFADFGHEDLPNLVRDSVSMVGRDGGNLWGFVSLQPEERPSTLADDAPTRCYFRALSLRGGFAPTEHVRLLLQAALAQLDVSGGPMLVIAYGGDSWIVGALRDAGFELADHVQFYELDHPHRQVNQQVTTTSAAVLRPADSNDIGQLADMDAAAFPPLWHFSQKDMFELFLRSRMTVATGGGGNTEAGIVGYTAAVANSSDELQLARLAVRPDLQRTGIGRQLLVDVVAYAAAERYERILLNTQTDNERSQGLYRSVGFRPVGLPVPVLTRLINETPHETQSPEP